MLRKFSLSLLAIIVAGGALLAHAQPQTLLTHHTRDAVLSGQAPYLGKLPANQILHFDVVLAVRDQAGLDRFLQEAYDPSSPSYHQFLTVKQFTEKFGPSQKDYDALTHFSKANGFTITGGSRDAMDVRFTASVASIETAFHVTLGLYHDPLANRDFYAIDREPSVDLPFQLWHITGLDSYSVPRRAVMHKPAGIISAATTGSCPQQAFCGSDMRAAYYTKTSLTGHGQYIGLLEFYGFDIQDINTYYKNAKQTRTAIIKGVSTDGSPILCKADQGCDDLEQTIDMTQSLGMAPGVNTLFNFISNSSDTAMLSAMSSNNPLPLNLSSSWSWYPPDPSDDDPYFKKFAAQGQSYFEAAGDDGAWQPCTECYLWPADSPYVITVGGTDLTTQGPGQPWASETVWSQSGGGIDPDDNPIPSWQLLKGVITKANKGSTKYRNGPDVTGNANFTYYVCANQQACTSNEWGGTSFAAPMWAGYLALTNEQAAAHKESAPGFINPTIYPKGLTKDYDNYFHDITVGSNGFPATKRYDLASGWGSPNTDGLIDLLAPLK
jgi:subtilase family serine protease